MEKKVKFKDKYLKDSGCIRDHERGKGADEQGIYGNEG